eukprot:TRINITY_DN372_c0_g1_i1.p1 TRINITY_DN372_c0_g1~~TRINITY_DN372_c0_g1_i1.p1  ORF type:complete len:751 (-),score=156.03 TRINITY_DN372_c0_g1_i1:411-2663(-)
MLLRARRASLRRNPKSRVSSTTRKPLFLSLRFYCDPVDNKNETEKNNNNPKKGRRGLAMKNKMMQSSLGKISKEKMIKTRDRVKKTKDKVKEEVQHTKDIVKEKKDKAKENVKRKTKEKVENMWAEPMKFLAIFLAFATGGTLLFLFLKDRSQLEKQMPLQENSHQSFLNKTRMRRLFKDNSSTTKNNEIIMTADDFVSYLRDKDISSETLKSCFLLADWDCKGYITFDDYYNFFAILEEKDGYNNLLFRLFDNDGDGLINYDDFTNGIKLLKPSLFYMTQSHDFLTDFFGKEHEKSVPRHHFNSMLKHVNYLSALGTLLTENDEFTSSPEEILERVSKYYDLVPEYLVQNIPKISDGSLTLQQCKSILKIANYAKNIEDLLLTKSEDDAISKELLKNKLNYVQFSNEDIDTLVNVFDYDKSGFIDGRTYSQIKEAQSPRTVALPEYRKAIEPGPGPAVVFGQVSSIVAALVVYPLDKLKTRVQSKHGKSKILFTLKEIIKGDGIRGIYKGLGTQLVGITPEKTLKITVNDFLRRYLKSEGQDTLTLPKELLAGVGTGLIQVSISTPYELVKIRVQMQTGKKKQKSAIRIIRELGIRGLYTGLSATLLRDIPFNAIYFTLYAYLKGKNTNEDGELDPLKRLLCSGSAAAIAAAADTPADCIKTRLQNGAGEYNGIIDCVQKTIQTEGYQALAKGLSLRVGVIAPLFAISFGTYETLKDFSQDTTFLVGLKFDRDYQKQCIRLTDFSMQLD